MKTDYRRLIVWSIIFYFAFSEMSDAARDGLLKVLMYWTHLKGFTLGLSSISIFTLFALGAYTIFYWLPKLNNFLKILLLLLNIIVVIAFRYLLEQITFPAILGFKNYENLRSLEYYFWDNLYYAVIFTGLGIVFYFVQTSQYEQKKRLDLQIQNQKTELAFLRSQLNPHFLFNTLNNIYTLVYQKSERALLAMDKLTTLLRYALYEGADLVPVERELEYLNDFIDLQLMRYDFEIPLEMKVEERVKPFFIPPFIFIAFVENAFKHGYFRDKQHPLLIELVQEEDQLHFYSWNAVRTKQKDSMGGIGLKNIRKRLSLIYSDQHTLEVKDNGSHFEVSLKIPIMLLDQEKSYD